MRILVVEDEPKAARHLVEGLDAAGFQVQTANTGEAGLALAQSNPYDALVVDIMLPGMSGLAMVRTLRGAGILTPILFLSAKASLEDRVLGLEEGGDDYLVKPYAIPEVAARLRALLRRSPHAPTERIVVADLVWDPAQRRISRRGERVDLTPKEYVLAALLLQNLGEVVPRSLIVRTLWGEGIPSDSNAVDVQMLRLRKKLDDPYETKLIRTLRGVGVVLENREAR